MRRLARAQARERKITPGLSNIVKRATGQPVSGQGASITRMTECEALPTAQHRSFGEGRVLRADVAERSIQTPWRQLTAIPARR